MKTKKIPTNAADLNLKGRLTEIENKLFGFQNDRSENPHVNLKYIQTDFECFSTWGQDELKSFSEFIRKLSQMNWSQIEQQGGKLGQKTGLGMTKHKDHSRLPQRSVIEQISPDISFFELRITNKARVHGFRCHAAFFLVWLDRNHRINPM